MNMIHASQSVLDFTSATPSTGGRFQIYRESRGGNFVAGFSTDSDAEIIETFMFQAPAYDGGDIRLMDQSDQRMIACDLLKQKTICAAIEMRF